MRGLITIAIFVTFLLIIFSCSQGYIVNMNAKTDYPKGRNLYISKCGGCHQLFDPNSYTKSEWNKIMVAMQQKSKINDQQKNDIYDWILETHKSAEKVEASVISSFSTSTK